MKEILQHTHRASKQLQILDRIRRRGNGFSPKQQLIARYLVRDYKRAAFLNCCKLARELDVSEPTLYRFAVSLGYPGFPQMQVALQEMVLGELTTEDRLDLSFEESRVRHAKEEQPQDLFERIVMAEIETMKTLLRSVKREDLRRAVEMISEAERIFIVGLLGSAALAQYFAYNLCKLRPEVILIQHGDGEDFVRFGMVGPSSLVIIIAFPRYPCLTVQFANLAHKEKASIIGLTNNVLSPIASHCDVGFYIETQVTSFMDPLGAPIAMIHALTAEFTRRDTALTKHRLRDYEVIAKRQKLFCP